MAEGSVTALPLRTVTVSSKASGVTLVSFLRKNFRPPFSSVSHIRRCLERHWIYVNCSPQESETWRLRPGDVVSLVATTLDLDLVRFTAPLMPVLLSCAPQYVVLQKPAGMPLSGSQPDTAENALASCLAGCVEPGAVDNAQVVLSVGRSTHGPAIVSLNREVTSQFTSFNTSSLMRWTFRVIVHGDPPETLHDLAGFVSLERVSTTRSTGGCLVSLDVCLSTPGNALRRILHHHGCPVLGGGALTRSSKGSSANGIFLACTSVSFPDTTTSEPRSMSSPRVEVHLPLSKKFANLLEREERFYAVKMLRLQERQSTTLRMKREFAVLCDAASSDVHSRLYDARDSSEANFVQFCGFPFYTSGAVMKPRRSSEVLVEAACKRIDILNSSLLPKRCEDISAGQLELAIGNVPSILDIGVGCGSLLIGTQRLCTPQKVWGVGVDISPEALDVAEVNTTVHGLSLTTKLILGDFRNLNFEPWMQGFDIILCNPPYLTESELQREVDDIEGPAIALVAEDASFEILNSSSSRGMGCYEAIARQLGSHRDLLSPHGFVIVEVGGKRHVDSVVSLFSALAGLRLERVELDSNGFQRCVIFCRPQATS